MQVKLSDGRTVDTTAWTGGDPPPKNLRHPVFMEIRDAVFRDQVADCGGLDLWVYDLSSLFYSMHFL